MCYDVLVIWLFLGDTGVHELSGAMIQENVEETGQFHPKGEALKSLARFSVALELFRRSSKSTKRQHVGATQHASAAAHQKQPPWQLPGVSQFWRGEERHRRSCRGHASVLQVMRPNFVAYCLLHSKYFMHSRAYLLTFHARAAGDSVIS